MSESRIQIIDNFDIANNDALIISKEYDLICNEIKKNVKTVEAFNWSW